MKHVVGGFLFLFLCIAFLRRNFLAHWQSLLERYCMDLRHAALTTAKLLNKLATILVSDGIFERNFGA